MTVIHSRKTFFVLLCLLFFFNGIGLIWKRRITEKNSGWISEFSIKNIQTAKSLSNWKGSVLETKTNTFVIEGNNSFIDFNNECDEIYDHENKCEFVRQYCRDYSSGLINYLQFYFCSKKWRFLIMILLFLWLLFLFGFTGIAASEFFCPNLNTIASKLRLSESMAGMTFLAFGNGSPDLFSTFSAISHESGSLAIGELIGAASFITSVVAGSVAIVSPFRIKKAPFLRDVIFFLLAICVVLAIIWDGKIFLWESIILVLFYFIYVCTVAIGSWWATSQKRRKWQERRARDEYTPALLINDDTENVREHNEDEFDTYNETDFLISENESYGSRDVSVPLGAETYNIPPYRPSFTRSARPIYHRMRPSLFGAIEFRDAINSLKSDSNARALGVFGRNYTTDFYNSRSGRPRSRTMPMDRPLLGRSWASDNGGIMSIPIINFENPNGDSNVDMIDQEVTSERNAESLSNDPSSTPVSKQDLSRSDALSIPHLMLIPPTSDQEATSPDRISSSSSLLSPRSPVLPPLNLNYILDGSLHSSPRNSPLQTPLHFPDFPPVMSFWDKVRLLLFPCLEGFSQKSFIAKLIALLATPGFLLLILTLPVVESEETDSDDIENKNYGTTENQLQTPTIVVEHDPNNEERKGTRWNRWLTAAQLVFAPLFVSFVLFPGDYKILLFFVLGGSIASIMCILFTRDDKPPRFHSLLCYIGFGIAIVWIYLVANEVVGLLQAIGLIMGLSDAIIGLTIFAMGNSLGDFVANITIAKMGFPTMAVSACFGGPMLNILLGIGIAGTYTTIHLGHAIDITIEPTLFISSMGLLITLFSFLIFLPRNDFHMTRGWGCYIISVYLICMIINVTLELIKIYH
ncbi:Sodium/calcium exchanger protein [Rhizophagus diaphanus]|nr:Sodium/calcium exchanger protein [Rhizophagus diaphanus] [Rhizophagus sp. MUCL 43196]